MILLLGGGGVLVSTHCQNTSCAAMTKSKTKSTKTQKHFLHYCGSAGLLSAHKLFKTTNSLCCVQSECVRLFMMWCCCWKARARCEYRSDWKCRLIVVFPVGESHTHAITNQIYYRFKFWPHSTYARTNTRSQNCLACTDRVRRR